MSTLVYSPVALELKLPWQTDQEQEEAFKRWLKRLVIPLLLLFLIIPWLPTYDREYEEVESTIVKTQIVLEPIVVEPEPTPEPKKPAPVKAPEPKAKPVQKDVVKPKEPKPAAELEKKRDVAQEQGLTAISSQLDSLRQSLDLSKLQKKNVSTSQGGKIARAESTVLGEDALTQKSQGIVVDDAMLKDKKIALAAHESTKQDGFVDDGDASSDAANFYSDLKGQRSIESIRRVLEGGKSKAYMYYLRALRDTPSLEGTLVFELVIEPNGAISGLRKMSSELNSPELENKILGVIQALNFGAEDVSPRTLKYKFTFLPS